MRKLAHWLESYGNAESVDILRDLALSHTPFGGSDGKKIEALIRRGDLAAVCDYKLNYSAQGVTSESLRHCRQAIAFFSKLEDLEIGVDKERVAYDKFMWAEQRCRETNAVFGQWSSGRFQFRPRVESVLFLAQRKIATVLGPFPALERLGLRFGKGATTLTKKREASVVEKFGAGVACSEELFPLAASLLGEMPHLAALHSVVDRVDEDGDEWSRVPIVINDGKLEFVPKNANTYRATVTEPPLNGMFQMAVGDYMVRRFRAFGLDLKDQSANQRLALIGSLTGALATLDQKSASDLLALELVFNLLPHEWAHRLAYGRTGHVVYRDQRIRMEKFSSMGNGFTFPLESLIFWALAKACVEVLELNPTREEPYRSTVSVFGDDVICPTEAVELITEVYSAVGFVLNEDKSFSTGPFRESCGKDYYKGIDIRPYYQKDLVSPRTLFILHNHYVRCLDYDRAEGVLNRIHPCLRIWGPDGYGDGHLLGDHPMYRKPRHDRLGYSGYTFDTFSPKGRRDIRPQRPGDGVLPSYSIYRRSSEHVVPCLQNAVKRIGEVLVGSVPSSHAISHVRFLSIFSRGHGNLSSSTPIPDSKQDDGTTVKAVALPIADEAYKRVSIYILG